MPSTPKVPTQYRTLARLRLEHPALRSAHMYPAEWDERQTQFSPTGVGVDVARQVAIYHRRATLPGGDVENVVVALNFSDNEQWLSVPFPLTGPGLSCSISRPSLSRVIAAISRF